MNAQEVFDTVARHLLQQGGPARTPDTNSCRYRDPNGTKCAVGILIPDDKYDRSMEGHRVNGIVRDFDLSDTPLPAHVDLLWDLQNVHDDARYDVDESGGVPVYRWADVAHLKDALANVAHRRGLTAEVLQ